MEQVTLNFDSTGFENIPTLHDYIVRCSFSAKDEKGRTIHQNTQAMLIDRSPTQWNQKIHRTNNTCITVDDLEEYTLKVKDDRWLDYAFWKYRINDNSSVDELERMKLEIEKKIEAKKSLEERG